MKFDSARITLRGLLLVVAFAAAGEAAAYSTSFTGAPASIACTDTSVTLASGLTLNWDLFSGNPGFRFVGTAGGVVVANATATLPGPSGSTPLGGVAIFPSTTQPYTFTYSITPELRGATTTSFSLLCSGGVGSAFTISNGAPFQIASIPTLGTTALAALAALLGLTSLFLLRRRLSVRR